MDHTYDYRSIGVVRIDFAFSGIQSKANQSSDDEGTVLDWGFGIFGLETVLIWYFGEVNFSNVEPVTYILQRDAVLNPTFVQIV